MRFSKHIFQNIFFSGESNEKTGYTIAIFSLKAYAYREILEKQTLSNEVVGAFFLFVLLRHQ